MESVSAMVLVFVLITAVVAALIAFVVLPSLSGEREEGEGVPELAMVDYVRDINAANKAGYDYDMRQDERLNNIENRVGIDSDSSAGVEPAGTTSSGGFDWGSVATGILDNLVVTTPSEEGGVSEVKWGPFSVPTDLSEVCYNESCFRFGGTDPPSGPGDSSGAVPDSTGEVEEGGGTEPQPVPASQPVPGPQADTAGVAGFAAWPTSSGMYRF